MGEMRNPLFFLIFALIVLLYGLLNYYIGLRGWQTLGVFLRLNRKIYWVLFWCLAFSYIAGRVGHQWIPAPVSRSLTLIGANWLALMYYFILVIAVLDLIRLIGRLTGWLPEKLISNPLTAPAAGLAVLLLVTSIWAYGTWNARHPRVTRYDLTVDKQAGSLKKLHIVMVSDIHLGTIIGNGRLTQMVDMVNGLNPDIVLFAGDVIDEDIGYFIEKKMDHYFRKIRSRYGTFAVLGNHEYLGRHAEEAVRQLEKAGVTVLRDDYVKVAGSFYVAGRDDRSGARFTGHQRKKLKDVLNGVNKSLPVILMDHQPATLEEAVLAGIDLQLSGHTHRGQMFPNQLITKRIYETDWGYLKKKNLQVIVSSGYGTWGPPIRVGNISEIVDISIRFKE